jgi:Immunoglobulin-like domain of bacterial spore germination/Sporulation and spore germination
MAGGYNLKRAAMVMVLFLSCRQQPAVEPVPEPAPTATVTATSPSTPAPTPRPTPTPVPPREQNIYIDSVTIANPIVVTGRSRTFENTVSLRLRDARGAQMTETFTTSNGEIGHHNPFRATLYVTRDPGENVTVEALDYSAKDGSEQYNVSVTRPFRVELVDARLFLPNKDCTGVVARTRRIPKSISMARLLVEVLIAEPAPFPKGSAVRSINLRDGTLTVDFNERLQNVGGACAAQMIRQSVTQTLLALPSVKKVVITAGGSEALALQP